MGYRPATGQPRFHPLLPEPSTKRQQQRRRKATATADRTTQQQQRRRKATATADCTTQQQQRRRRATATAGPLRNSSGSVSHRHRRPSTPMPPINLPPRHHAAGHSRRTPRRRWLPENEDERKRTLNGK